MSAKETRLKFGKAFNRFQGSVKKMGVLAYNLLHDPDRDKKLDGAKSALNELIKLAKDFDNELKKQRPMIDSNNKTKKQESAKEVK